MQNATGKMNTQKIKDVVSWGFFIAALILCIITAFKIVDMQRGGDQAFLFGYRPARVMTGSMEPYLMTDSLCMNKALTSPEDVEIGDVITYQIQTNEGEKILVTHRVIDIKDGLYYFKGDNNRVDDGYGLPYESLVSEVLFVWNWAVPVVQFGDWVCQKWEEGLVGKFVCLCVGVAIICAYNLICTFLEWIWGLIFKKNHTDNTAIDAGAIATNDSLNPEPDSISAKSDASSER